MKNIIFSLFAITIGSFAIGQVGINTETPKATLDVVGNPTVVDSMDGVIPPRLTGDQLSAKNYTAEQQGAIVYVTDAATDLVGQVAEVVDQGLYHFDGTRWQRLDGEKEDSGLGSSVYSASKKGGWSLLSLNIGDWAKIKLNDLEPKIGGNNVNVAGDYVAPSSGYYQVVYEWQLDAGVNIELLGSKKIGLIKNPLTTAELVDSKVFDGVRVSLLNITLAAIPLTSTTMSTFVELKKGDQLSFVTESSLLDLGLLNSARVVVHVHKIANA